ncbi:hypothetical protein CHARACLAT_013593 [Characodon lateralis]|uniref:Uncharacterized protein n=1 Tax=Characodon lateralis TaxID=208331 RepID=A0ABU7E9B8_9TELE|nr:hypothetical protein [Characodon lateralis]
MDPQDQIARSLLASPALPVHPPTLFTIWRILLAQHPCLSALVSVACPLLLRTNTLVYNELIPEARWLRDPDTAQKYDFNKLV